MAKLLVSLTEGAPSQAAGSAPDPTGLTATAVPRGCVFIWDLNLAIRPFSWFYRTRVAAGAWSGWIETLYPIVIRMLTDAEAQAAGGTTASVQIEVYSTDGITPSSTVADDAQALVLNTDTTDLVALKVTLAKLAADATAKMFVSTDRDGADLKAGSVALTKLGTTATARMFTDGTRTAALVTTVGSTAAATVESNAAAGAAAKVVTDAGATNWDTAFANYLDQTAVDARIVFVRPDEDYKNSNTTKAQVRLTNVEDKSAVTILGELTETQVQAADGVTKGAGSNLAASINALTAAITSATLVEVVSSIIKEQVGGTALFDASGNLTFGALGGVGIKSGASIITPAELINAINAATGNSQNLDLGSIALGDLNSIPITGTAKWVIANEKLGAARAFIAIDSSNRIIGNQWNGVTALTQANLVPAISERRQIWTAHGSNAAGGAIVPVLSVSGAGIGSSLVIHQMNMVYNTSYKVLYFSCMIKSSDTIGQFRLRVRNSAKADLGAGSFIVANNAAYQLLECFVAISGLGSVPTANAMLFVDLEVEETNAQTVDIDGGTLNVGLT